MGHSDTVARSCALKLKITNNVPEIPVYRNGTKEISIITSSDRPARLPGPLSDDDFLTVGLDLFVIYIVILSVLLIVELKT